MVPWGVLSLGTRTQLEDCRGTELHIRHQGVTPGTVQLDRHHTHLILVDDGQTGVAASGCELRLRLALERHYAAQRMPRVMLLLQGGPQALALVAAALECGAIVIVVAESGGAAALVAQMVDDGAPPTRLSPRFERCRAELDAISRLVAASGRCEICEFVGIRINACRTRAT